MRRIAALLAAVLLTALSLDAVSAPATAHTATAAQAPSAQAKNKACVTRAEYKKVKKGMTKAKVAKIFCTKGKLSSKHNLPGGQKLEARGYKVCTSKKGGVGISFLNKGKGFKLEYKTVAWK